MNDIIIPPATSPANRFVLGDGVSRRAGDAGPLATAPVRAYPLLHANHRPGPWPNLDSLKNTEAWRPEWKVANAPAPAATRDRLSSVTMEGDVFCGRRGRHHGDSGRSTKALY